MRIKELFEIGDHADPYAQLLYCLSAGTCIFGPAREGSSLPSSTNLPDSPDSPTPKPNLLIPLQPHNKRVHKVGEREHTTVMPGPPQASSSSSALPIQSARNPLDRGSPPPYTPEPPSLDPNSPFLAKRATSSPHLQSPPHSPHIAHVYPQSHSSSRRPSSSALQSHPRSRLRLRSGNANIRVETEDDDTDTCSSGDDAVAYRSRERGQPLEQVEEQTFAHMLRERLFGKGKGRADAAERVRSITTAPGVVGAGETETESDDVVSLASSECMIFCTNTALEGPLGTPSPLSGCPCNVDSALVSIKFNFDLNSCSIPLAATQSTHRASDHSFIALVTHSLPARRVNVYTHPVSKGVQ